MSFREKMVVLRKVAKEWQQEKRKKDRQSPQDIQKELDNILGAMNVNDFPLSIKCHIRDLEKRKIKLLQQEEASWRLKSRAIWLKDDDRNTRFFHKIANARPKKTQSGELLMARVVISFPNRIFQMKQ